MLELIVQFPDGSNQAQQWTSCPLEESTLILRGFEGERHTYKPAGTLDQEVFWESYKSEVFSAGSDMDAPVYQHMLEQAINAIQQHDLHKVVLSRDSFLEVKNAAPKATFESLRAHFPQCTVFALKSRELGHWMGASPEILLESVEEGYRSMSLAGTRLQGGSVWGAKELDEQKFVTKEIHRTLKEFGGKVTRGSQETFPAGPVEHLLTWVNTDVEDAVPVDMLEALHPTPAVCGTPTESAKELIEDLESYDRELYTGYLAFTEPKVHATVLLRTMKWYTNGIRFFAGGGITKDSVPLNEWMETEYKISALKDAVILE